MIKNIKTAPANDEQLPALTGIRFFAIFHIFIFHLWTLYSLKMDAPFNNLLKGFNKYSDEFIRFCSNGWMATSFFFLLSGFILSYLYWQPNGLLSTSRKEFWVKRFSRIYPIHIILLIPTFFLMVGFAPLETLAAKINFAAATFSSLTLTQAWYPPWVPVLSWPTWTLSALVFLYLIAPWLMRVLAKLNQRQLVFLLILMPIVSLLPTAITAIFIKNPQHFAQNESIFVGSIPAFWVPHFIAGLILARICHIQRGKKWRPNKRKLISFGDLAIITVLAICLLPDISHEPFKYFMRHGLMMPLYMIIVVDLAKQHGLAARLFSLPGMQFLGQTGFSLFVWQNLIMIFCWISLLINPKLWTYQLEVACLGLILIGMFSTYKIEQPLAKLIRKRLLVQK